MNYLPQIVFTVFLLLGAYVLMFMKRTYEDTPGYIMKSES